MNYATIKYCDIANGEGVRTSLFVSGCRRHCPNCFNAVAWDFGYGAPFTKEVRNEILEVWPPATSTACRCWAASPLSRRTSASCCPLSKMSRCCTRTKRSGAIPATIWSMRSGSPAPAAVRSPMSSCSILMCWWTAILCRISMIFRCGSAVQATRD